MISRRLLRIWYTILHLLEQFDPDIEYKILIMNIKETSKDAIDGSFKSLRAEYGNPFEFFTQIQWDGKQEYIAYIVSGMKMPIDEIEAVYNRYKEQSSKINKNGDEFFARISEFDALDEDSQFNMIKEAAKATSLTDFLNNN